MPHASVAPAIVQENSPNAENAQIRLLVLSPANSLKMSDRARRA